MQDLKNFGQYGKTVLENGEVTNATQEYALIYALEDSVIEIAEDIGSEPGAQVSLSLSQGVIFAGILKGITCTSGKVACYKSNRG